MFFGIDWFAALVQVSFKIVFALVNGLVFCIAWNAIAPIYFPFLPEIWQNLPYFKVVGFWLIIGYIGSFIQMLTPKIVSIDNSSK